MEKLKFILVVMILTAPVAAQSQEKPYAVQRSFGRYGHDCSSGRGACSFAVVKPADHVISGATSYKINATTIALQMNRAAVSKEEEISIAGKPFASLSSDETPTFIQQDALQIDLETLTRLNIDHRYNQIKAGNYPLNITKDSVEVIFTLTTSN